MLSEPLLLEEELKKPTFLGNPKISEVIADTRSKSEQKIDYKEYLYPKFDILKEALNEDGSNFQSLIEEISINFLKDFPDELKENYQNIDEVCSFFIEYFKEIYKKVKDIPENLKNLISNNSFLKKYKIDYIENSLTIILKDKKINTYDQLGYVLYLLLTLEDYEVLDDLKNNRLKKLIQLLKKCSDEILILIGELHNTETATLRHDTFNYMVECFLLLSESINKIALDKLVDNENIALVENIYTSLSDQITDIIPRLQNSTCNKETLRKLKFLEGKIQSNFVYKIGIIDGETKAIIDEQAEDLTKQTRRGLIIQEESGYGGDLSKEKDQRLMCELNVAIIQLRKAKRYKEIGEDSSEEMKKGFDQMISIYNKHEKNLKITTPEDVISSIIESDDIMSISNIELEIAEYFLIYHKFDDKILLDFLLFLTNKKNAFENAYLERLKINIIEQIILKLQPKKSGILQNLNISEDVEKTISKTINYIKLNANSHLISNYSKIYLAIALFYSNHFSDENRLKAVEYYHLFGSVYGKDTELYRRINNTFLINIGRSISQAAKSENELVKAGTDKYADLSDILDERLKNTVSRKIGNLISHIESRTYNSSSIDRSLKIFCRIIERYIFNNHCSVRIIKDCETCSDGDKKCSSCAKNFRRGWYGIETIPLSLGYIIVFEFSNSWRHDFFAIFNQQKKRFIKQNLGTLLKMFLNNQLLEEQKEELRQKNEQLEHNSTHDKVTGLPNKEKLERDINNPNMKSVGRINITAYLRSQENSIKGRGKTILQDLAAKFKEFAKKNSHLKIYAENYDFFILYDGDEQIDFKDVCFNEVSNIIYSTIPDAKIVIVTAENQIEGILEKLGLSLEEAIKSGTGVHIYSDAEKLELTQEQNRVNELLSLEALKLNYYEPFIQPKIDNKTGKITGFEILARIVLPNGTILPPIVFLEHLRRYGLLGYMTKMVLKKASIYLSKSEYEHLEFSINMDGQDLFNEETLLKNREILSARKIEISDFLNEEDIKDTFDVFVERQLKDHKINPERMTIEILENTPPEVLVKGQKILENIKILGCKFGIDDFGQLYGNFQRLIELIKILGSLDYLKLDGVYTRNLLSDDKEIKEISKIGLKSLLDLAKKLGVKSVVEYVENEEILDIVSELGADFSQGYGSLVGGRGKPLHIKKLLEMVEGIELLKELYVTEGGGSQGERDYIKYLFQPI